MPERDPGGATPAGARDGAEAAAAVRTMFDSVAPRYDRLNHVLSLNTDRWWWWRTARRFRTVLARPQARVADICCGTGDMTLALLKRRPAASVPIVAVDFSHPMLLRGALKFRRRPATVARAIAVEGDALRLPLATGSLHLLTTAFGFRNLGSYRDALAEFFRVLAPGGELGILDFAEPSGLLGHLYRLYFRRVLPPLSARLGGPAAAYQYLPASVERFPAPARMLELLAEAGFVRATWTPYSFGIAGLFRAEKPPAAPAGQGSL